MPASSRMLTVIAMAIASFHALAAHGQTSAQEKTLLQVDQARRAFMVSGDFIQLERLLDDKLEYVHSNGKTDAKQSLLLALKNKTIDYLAISPDKPTILLSGELAVFYGRVNIKVKTPQATLQFNAHYTAVYRKTAGAWQLYRWQTTKLPEEAK